MLIIEIQCGQEVRPTRQRKFPHYTPYSCPVELALHITRMGKCHPTSYVAYILVSTEYRAPNEIVVNVRDLSSFFLRSLSQDAAIASDVRIAVL